MVQNKIVKKFLGTAKYMASLTFYHTRKHYNAQLKVGIEIYDGRNLDGEFECYNISEVGKKVMDFYKEKIGHDIEIRRLARWFLEYLEEAGVTPPEMSVLIQDLQSTPTELEARYGKPFPYKDTSDKVDDDDDKEEDELEEAVEEVAEDIEDADEDLTEEEIIEEVIEEVVEEVLEDTLEEAVDEDVDEDIVEDVAEEIAEEVTEDIAEEITEEVVEETPTEEDAEEPADEFMTEPVDLSEEEAAEESETEEAVTKVPEVPVIEEPVEEKPTEEVDELEEAFEEFAD
ncbi:MAG: hypothetical protein ACTSO7_02770 [Candidatus Heimdallarchaeota archaeon]